MSARLRIDLWARCLIIAMITITMLPKTASVAQDPVDIIIGTTDFPRTLDPADAIDYPSWELMNHLYTGLTRQVPGTLTFELALADQHIVSDDGLLHTFVVRPGATFDDGTAITAAVFTDAINRVIDSGRNSADLINRYVTGVAVSEDIDNAVAFRLTVPMAATDFEALVALPPFYPQHPGVFPEGDLLDIYQADSFVGNGVYRLESIQPAREIVLAANDSYGGPPAANDRIILRRYRLPIDLRRAIQAHEIDIAWQALALPDLDAIMAAPDIVIQRQPNLQTFYMVLNQEQLSINNQNSFDDPAIREAFALLIDRERSAAFGFDETVTPLYSLLPPQFGGGAVVFPARDTEQADAVLTEAGYSPRRRPVQTPLYISTDNYGDLMGAAAQEVRRAVEDSEIANISAILDDGTETFTRTVYRGEYLSAIIGWRPPFASPAGYLLPLAHSGWRIPDGAGYASVAIDNLLRDAALAAGPDERALAYQAVERLLLADFALLPLWQGIDVIAYRENITGITLEANSWLRYETLSRR